MKASEVQQHPMRRVKATLTGHCPRCNEDTTSYLPQHPAGLAHCSVCGISLDMFDTEAAKRREYLDCWQRIDGMDALTQACKEVGLAVVPKSESGRPGVVVPVPYGSEQLQSFEGIGLTLTPQGPDHTLIELRA